MDFGLILILMLVAADGVIGMHVLQMPIVACTLMGFATNNVEAALQAGAMAQIVYMLLQDEGFEAGLFSATAVMVLGSSASAGSMAAGAATGVLFGAALEAVLRLINTCFLPAARKAAGVGNDKKLTTYTILPLVLRVVAAGAAGAVLVKVGAETFAGMETDYAWLLNGVITACSMLKYLGFAVILRNLTLKDMPGALCAGIAVGVLFAGQAADYGLVACALIAFAVAAYDLHQNSKKKQTETSAVKGGAEKWW